jgi:ribonuclease HI
MKQKIAVRALIKQDGKVLLLRRSMGLDYLRGKYELPGGRVDFGETPQQALGRKLRQELSVGTETMQLHDVISYFDDIDKSTHFLDLIYLVSLAPNDHNIKLGSSHDRFVWKKVSEIQPNEMTNVSYLALHVPDEMFDTEVVGKAVTLVDAKSATSERVIVYSDGGSRGNPGPSAAGYVVMDTNENVLFEGGKYLGVTTNNQAEYQAVYLGLAKAKELGAKSVEFRMDSLLVCNQMNGIYKIKNRDLWPIHTRIKDLSTYFEKVTFSHVRREFNQLADGMVNRVLDEQAKK